MSENEKPQAFNNLGRSLDGESINDNYSDLDRLAGLPKYEYGKSSPMITNHDIAAMLLIPDSNFVSSYDKTNSHLWELGLTPIWSRADYAKAQRYKWKTASWKSYAAVAR